MRGTLVVLLFALGCDSKATATDPQGAAPRPERLSKEYESCGASMHCGESLRCLSNSCARPARSVVGDYYAAVGLLASTQGEHEAAIAAYASALGQYDAEKVALPPDVDCAYGAALAAGRATRRHAELGARVLHRCVLAVPAGSQLREDAIGWLARLGGESGLDPLLLGASKTADLYLTKGAARPATDKLTISVTATPQPAKSFTLLTEKFGEADLRNALVACWEQYHGASKKNVLQATVGFKSGYVAAEYEDEPGRYVLKFDPPVALPPGPEATADACVRAIVEPAVKTLKISESFTTKLTVTVK
jgi:hypothetical protein